MSKKCMYCGNELEESAMFCDECGKKQDESVKEQAANKSNRDIKNEIVQESIEKKELTQDEVVQKNCKVQQSSEKKDNPKSLAVIGLLLGLISIALFMTVSFVSIVTSLAGVVISIKGLKSTNKICAILGLLLNILVAGVVISAVVAGIMAA